MVRKLSYYLNLTEDSYVNISTNQINYYGINLQLLGSYKSGNILLPAGEYLIKSASDNRDFTIESTYFNQ